MSVPARPGAALAGRIRAGAVLLAAALGAACAAPAPGGASVEAADHPDARFLVDYGGKTFRVNVRYVDIISESVIVVRRGEGGADPGAWRSVEVKPDTALPEGQPFAAEAWRSVAVDIADAIQQQPPICIDGARMRLATDADDDARTLYRDSREAWVVFALCPAGQAGGEG